MVRGPQEQTHVDVSRRPCGSHARDWRSQGARHFGLAYRPLLHRGTRDRHLDGLSRRHVGCLPHLLGRRRRAHRLGRHAPERAEVQPGAHLRLHSRGDPRRPLQRPLSRRNGHFRAVDGRDAPHGADRVGHHADADRGSGGHRHRACRPLAPVRAPEGQPEHAGRLLAHPADVRRQLPHHHLSCGHPVHGLPRHRPAARHGLRTGAALGFLGASCASRCTSCCKARRRTWISRL